MKFDIAAIFEQIVGFYAKLPLAQKIALPLLVAASMGLIVFVSRWATQPEYEVLFSNLEEADASGIVERLKEQKVSFRLRNEGRTIDVSPPAMVHEVRLSMAGLGLPKGGNVGFELFNETKLGQTMLSEAVNYIRSLQGELERTIQSIDAISAVRVHITNPKRSAFVQRDVLPTASVLIKLKPGAELTAVQVKGIAHLVSGSIERLTPDNVTILDQNGTMLNVKKEEQELAGADMTRLDYQRQIESSYSKRIETMLAEVLGVGRAVARVTAELDFNRFEKEEENYDPAGMVTRSERSLQENSGLTAEGGIPGVISNMTNDQGALTPPDNTKNANVRHETVKNFEVSRAVSRTVAAPGKISKMSVAVLVDGQHIKMKAPDGTEAPEQYKPLSTDMMHKIENLVKQAVGFDATRGDIVTVENIRFQEPDESLNDGLAAGERQLKLETIISAVLAVIGALAFFLVIVRPMIRFLVTPTESEVDLSRLLPAGIEELEAELEAERGKLSTLPDISAPAIDIEELEALLGENSRMVKESPQQAALLIRYWLNDGRI